jgi:hypothetical protein
VSYPAFYAIENCGHFTGGKRSVREAGYSPPSNVEAENEWSYTVDPRYAFLA